jgi:cell division protein FtsW
LSLFLILIWRGIRTALAAPDRFGALLTFGIIAIIAVQVMINISVVIGLMPVTGITLPLISAGGSSLTILLTALGIVLNISKHARWHR